MLLVLVVLFFLPFVLADDLAMHDSLDISLVVEGNWSVTPSGHQSALNSVSTDLLLVPQNDFRQEITDWKSSGIKMDKDGTNTDGLYFNWEKPVPEKASFGYTSTIHTKNVYRPISTVVSFPILDSQLHGVEQYLLPTVTIDSTNPAVVAKAAELAQGQKDLFKVSFVMASWIEQNVKYDLNSLTSQASQKASWVLEHKEGVCDEMSSLFIAMARSQGIPARFVSGISYSTSDLFDTPWQPHGWAEVYFPNAGWIPFDIAFGEYGYVDVTHIRMSESDDPTTPATSYQWFGNGADLTTNPLRFDVSILKQGMRTQESLVLKSSVLSDTIEFGSYDLVKATLKNTADSYTATTLQLSAPKEVSILGRNRRSLLLMPQETRETYWVVRAPQDLDTTFYYHFPFLVYTEKNLSVQGEFTAKPGSQYYSQEDINKLTIKDEEKEYSHQVDLVCETPTSLVVGEKKSARCTIRNQGAVSLDHLRFCANEQCKTVDVAVDGSAVLDVTLATSRAGVGAIILTAENNIVERRVRFAFLVLDAPQIKVSLVVPESAKRRETIPLEIDLTKISFTPASNVSVTLHGSRFDHVWTLDHLTDAEKFVLELSDPPLSFNNTYVVDVSWFDDQGHTFHTSTQGSVRGDATSFQDKIVFFFNEVLGVFS